MLAACPGTRAMMNAACGVRAPARAPSLHQFNQSCYTDNAGSLSLQKCMHGSGGTLLPLLWTWEVSKAKQITKTSVKTNKLF